MLFNKLRNSMSKEMLGGCCVCSDDRGWPENPLVYCDGQGCNVAVHQACYGIVTVPSGPWFCRKCELHERPRCELCPSKEGAFKKTDSNSWAHVVCALYIPEVRFGNVTTMEPILISLIPQERFSKTCYICDESSRGSSKASYVACMQCNKAGCRITFHVTCAQMLGLLCEEAGNMMDNVKYCGYCQHHYAKLKATRHVKIIPPYRPIPANNSGSVSPATLQEKSTHGQGNKSTTGGNSSGEDGKSTSANSSAQPGSASTPQNSLTESGKSTTNISPDINSSCSSKASSKNSKKGSSSYHGGSGSKSSSNILIDSKSGGSATSLPPTNTPSTSSSTASGVQTPPQTLEQLLELQWEQGSQFLMEQAQHLDIAQLLSCLNQLKQDNKALEEHVQSLIQRRDQLTAINARLSIPLGSSSALASLGGTFPVGVSTSNSTAHHNGHAINPSTPASNIHTHPPGGSGSKSHPVANSAPSPQQNDHGGPHHPRERNPYNGNADGGRAELLVTHSSQGGGIPNHHPGHQNHGTPHVGIHRNQMMDSSYNSYGAHTVPVVTSLSSPHSHPPNHPSSRAGR